MPSDLLSRPLIEIARDLREKRVAARELIEAAIARHERFGERLHAYSLFGAVLLAQNDEWLRQCRYMQAQGMAELAPPLIDPGPAKLPPMAA